jgi:hypothetical protein
MTSLLDLITQRYQELFMSCQNCTCQKACDFIPLDEDLYDEVDDKSFLPSVTDPRN